MFQNTLAELIRLLVAFFLLGFFLGCCFEFFRFLRVALRGINEKLAVLLHFFGDLLYFALAGCLTALAGYLCNRGRIRSDMLLFEFGGFLCYYFTLGRLLYPLAERLVALQRRGIRFLGLHCCLPIGRLIAAVFRRVRNAVSYRLLLRRSAVLRQRLSHQIEDMINERIVLYEDRQ